MKTHLQKLADQLTTMYKELKDKLVLIDDVGGLELVPKGTAQVIAALDRIVAITTADPTDALSHRLHSAIEAAEKTRRLLIVIYDKAKKQKLGEESRKQNAKFALRKMRRRIGKLDPALYRASRGLIEDSFDSCETAVGIGDWDTAEAHRAALEATLFQIEKSASVTTRTLKVLKDRPAKRYPRDRQFLAERGR